MATFDAPQSPIEAILQNMLGANNVLRAPQSRNEALLLQILDAAQHGGGEVTPASIITATGQMTAEQKAATTQNIGAVSSSEFTPTVILLSEDGGTVELDLSGIGLTAQQFFQAYIAGKRFYFLLAGGNGAILLTPTYFDEINAGVVLTGYDNGSLFVAKLASDGEYAMSGTLGIIQLEDTVVNVDGTTPTITPAANTIYNCGELTSLTISNPPATGAYSIVFTSGSTPTATVIPPKPAMRWQTADNEPPQGFPAANTRYEINVKDTYAVLGEWPVPEVSA